MSRGVRPWSTLPLLALALAAGCELLGGIDDPQLIAPAPPDAGMNEPPGFTFDIVADRIGVPLGGISFVDVRIVRQGGFDEAVDVVALGPPSGLFAPGTTIAPGQTSGRVQLSAAAPLAIGGVFTLTLEATSASIKSVPPDSADALVGGAPGSLDVGFGIGGQVTVNTGTTGGARLLDVQVTPDDKLVCGGLTFGPDNRYLLVLLRKNGDIDMPFGGEAIVKTAFAGQSPTSEGDVALRRPDGRIVQVGTRKQMLDDEVLFDIGVQGFLANGTIDPAFGVGGAGQSIVDIGGTFETATSVVLRDDGKLLVAGPRGGQFGQLAILQLDANGLLDTAGFHAPDGFVDVELESFEGQIVVDAQGRIYASGSSSATGQRQARLARLTADGQIDESFGSAGYVDIPHEGIDDRPEAMVLRPDGKLLAAGVARPIGAPVDSALVVYRFAADGTVEARLTPPVLSGLGTVQDIALDASGRLLVLSGAKLARLEADGGVDITFGAGGVATLGATFAGSIGLQADGRIILAGSTNAGGGAPTIPLVQRLWF
jgi:uncharacterized delta-60 repeat protein